MGCKFIEPHIDFMHVQISVNGMINPCEETNVAVDFLAPARPGRYISYWRLALPSGQRFGQRIWVYIKVVTLPLPAFGLCHIDAYIYLVIDMLTFERRWSNLFNLVAANRLLRIKQN